MFGQVSGLPLLSFLSRGVESYKSIQPPASSNKPEDFWLCMVDQFYSTVTGTLHLLPDLDLQRETLQLWLTSEIFDLCAPFMAKVGVLTQDSTDVDRYMQVDHQVDPTVQKNGSSFYPVLHLNP